MLAPRAKAYGLTVEQYKTNNVLQDRGHVEDVAELAAEMCGPLFAKTTAAQVPVDGGNETRGLMTVEALRWTGDALELLDQRLLPDRVRLRHLPECRAGRGGDPRHGGARRAGDRLRRGLRRRAGAAQAESSFERAGGRAALRR